MIDRRRTRQGEGGEGGGGGGGGAAGGVELAGDRSLSGDLESDDVDGGIRVPAAVLANKDSSLRLSEAAQAREI